MTKAMADKPSETITVEGLAEKLRAAEAKKLEIQRARSVVSAEYEALKQKSEYQTKDGQSYLRREYDMRMKRIKEMESAEEKSIKEWNRKHTEFTRDALRYNANGEKVSEKEYQERGRSAMPSAGGLDPREFNELKPEYDPATREYVAFAPIKEDKKLSTDDRMSEKDRTEKRRRAEKEMDTFLREAGKAEFQGLPGNHLTASQIDRAELDPVTGNYIVPGADGMIKGTPLMLSPAKKAEFDRYKKAMQDAEIQFETEIPGVPASPKMREIRVPEGEYNTANGFDASGRGGAFMDPKLPDANNRLMAELIGKGAELRKESPASTVDMLSSLGASVGTKVPGSPNALSSVDSGFKDELGRPTMMPRPSALLSARPMPDAPTIASAVSDTTVPPIALPAVPAPTFDAIKQKEARAKQLFDKDKEASMLDLIANDKPNPASPFESGKMDDAASAFKGSTLLGGSTGMDRKPTTMEVWPITKPTDRLDPRERAPEPQKRGPMDALVNDMILKSDGRVSRAQAEKYFSAMTDLKAAGEDVRFMGKDSVTGAQFFDPSMMSPVARKAYSDMIAATGDETITKVGEGALAATRIAEPGMRPGGSVFDPSSASANTAAPVLAYNAIKGLGSLVDYGIEKGRGYLDGMTPEQRKAYFEREKKLEAIRQQLTAPDVVPEYKPAAEEVYTPII